MAANALRLRCPLCGIPPMFAPALAVRTWSDWLDPLDGCPRCGYAYEREPGFYLLAIWAVNYGAVSLAAFAWYILLRRVMEVGFPEVIFYAVPPVPVAAVLIARHCKAFFLAADLVVDPHDGGR